MTQLTGAHLVMRCLKSEGINRIFTVVGDTILPLCDAALDEGIAFTDTRHEAAAVAMADAWCRITGEPAVVMVTGGPGFANAISGMPNVFTSESPVIFIAGCSELTEQGMYSFQEIDQIGMATPVTKGSWLIHHQERIPDMIATAFRNALSGRPGPVHLTIPIDIQERKVYDCNLFDYRPYDYRHSGSHFADPRLVHQALDTLSCAERPIVIAANATRYSVTQEDLQGFIESTGLPIFTVEQARGLISDHHPLCFGYADASLNEAAQHLREADAVLLLGKRLDHRFKYGKAPFFDPNTKIVQADPSPTEIGRNRGINLGVLADLGSFVGQLSEGAAKHKWKNLSAWTANLRSTRNSHLTNLASRASDAAPLHAMTVFKEVEPLINQETILIFDGGDFVQWGRGYLKASKVGSWLRLGPLAHLGFGIPYALAAKLARPKSDVLLFIGDGSMGFYTMEFDTAIRHNLPFTAIVGNDSVWGIDQHFQLAYFGRSVATDLRTVRYDKVIAAIGGYGTHVEQRSDIKPAISGAITSNQPAVVDITIQSAQSPLADAMVARKLASRG